MFGYPIYTVYIHNKPIIQWSVRNVKTSHTSIWKCKQLLYTGPKTSWKHRKKWRISRETFNIDATQRQDIDGWNRDQLFRWSLI